MTFLTLGSGTSAAPVALNYADDVFLNGTYTGTGAGKLLTGNINMSANGGLIWIKQRNNTTVSHKLTDTARGVTKGLSTDSTAAQTTDTNGLTSFNNGASSIATIGSDVNYNNTSRLYTSWAFRKAQNFFDVVTYTGNGTSQTINHNLAAVPGCIIVKAYSGVGSWYVYHSSTGAGNYCLLESTGAAQASTTIWNNTAPTSAQFSVGSGAANSNGVSYVAYIFSHDTTGSSIIKCGSFVSSGSGDSVNLGWEPQWLLYKRTTGAAEAWNILDVQRGYGFQNDAILAPNSNALEVAADYGNPTNTGFYLNNTATTSGATYMYIAVRRSNKPISAGTTVFGIQAVTGGSVPASISALGTVVTDMILGFPRLKTYTGQGAGYAWDRLRGNYARLPVGGTLAESATPADTLNSWDTASQSLGADSGHYCNSSSENYIYYAFKRAQGFFDQVCYTGTGSNATINHGLGATPELMIIKSRSTTGNWAVYHSSQGNTKYLQINSTAAAAVGSTLWNNTTPTSQTFTVGTSADVNTLSTTYCAYLFCTTAGVSKIGTYTGNGSSQTINCGFSAGARFVMIKCASTTGDWIIWDTVRGIVAANDPYLTLNQISTAEVTTNDSIDPDTSGFIVNQVAASNINVAAATYIYFAIA